MLLGIYKTHPCTPSAAVYRFLTVEVEFTRDSGGSGTSYSVLTGLYKGTAFSDRIWHIENDNGSGDGVLFSRYGGTHSQVFGQFRIQQQEKNIIG